MVLRKTLKNLIKPADQDICLVLDALDELRTDDKGTKLQDMLRLVTEIRQSHVNNLHILITSVREQPILESWAKHTESSTDANAEDFVDDNLYEYIKQAMNRHAAEEGWNAMATDRAKESLYRNAKG